MRTQSDRDCRSLYRFIRSRLGPDLSDREIARRWGMEWKSFAALKHGQRQVPRLRDLETLAAVLEVDPLVVFQAARGEPPCQSADCPVELALRSGPWARELACANGGGVHVHRVAVADQIVELIVRLGSASPRRAGRRSARSRPGR